MERTYHCAKIAKGTAEAEALVSKDAVCFYLVVPETGELIERNHDINGKNVAGKILIMPSAVAMEIPMVHKVDPEFFSEIKDGDFVHMDATNGVITVKS